MERYVCALWALFLSVSTVFADTITVYNESSDLLSVAIYYERGNNAERVSSVQKVNPSASIQIERPSYRLTYERLLIASYDESMLKDKLDKYEFAALASVDVGVTQGTVFYVAPDRGKLKGYNYAKWKVYRPIKESVVSTVADLTQQLKDLTIPDFPAVKDNPYKNQVAKVRVGNELSQAEQSHEKARMPRVQTALEKMIGTSLAGKRVPKIAVVMSGGGYRAMFSAAGAMRGLKKIGLLDAILKAVGLSGSTWFMAMWMHAGGNLDRAIEYLVKGAQRDLSDISYNEADNISEAFLIKWRYGQPITLVDLWGALLSNALFEHWQDARQRAYLSAQRQLVFSGIVPYPIYTAVRADAGAKAEWIEFTPEEIGGNWLKCYVPTWAFGRSFKNGTSQDFAPEQSLGYLMGIWGSAFAANMGTIAEEVLKKIRNPVVYKMIKDLVSQVKEFRFTTAQINNFTLGMNASPIANQRILNMADAGAAPGFNLPYPPVSGDRIGREADILIFIDASDPHVKYLRSVEDYARDVKKPLPPIDYTRARDGQVTIFKDEKNPLAPLIIYVPALANSVIWNRYKDDKQYASYGKYLGNFDFEQCRKTSYCSTFNLKYTREQSETVMAAMEFNVLTHKNEIIEAIKWYVDNHASA